MKKIYLGLVIAALIGLIVPPLVFAAEIDADDGRRDPIEDEFTSNIDDEDENVDQQSSNQQCVRIVGKWGHGKDEEADGFFAAKITRKQRVAVFTGMYNSSGEDDRNQIVGIMKKGYFNGKIITDQQEYKITGLYKIDKENKLLKMQWMTPGHAGWAVARLKDSAI